ncbi:DUF551 domain-containing protein [Escherichia coli]
MRGGYMTSKLTITDERVISVIERLEHYACNLKWTNVRGAQDLLTAADGLRELQERRKAAMDSEPVAVVEPSDYVTAAQLVGEGPARKAVHELYEGALRIGDKLYRHAQPAPVVPEEKPMPNPLSMYAIDAVAAIAEAKGWNACRAAMLQAGNSPVIPDGYRLQPISEYEAMCATVNSDEWPQRWIPVSERMPERGDYLVTDGRDFDVQSFDGEQFIPGFVWEDAITHWMPLPAAPQEVK